MTRQYSHAVALIVGVSRFASTTNPHLANYPDLPGVCGSVTALKTLWADRGFTVETVTDATPGDQVTRSAIVDAARRLVARVGDSCSKSALLVVHLLGHGMEDGEGGLLLSDAHRSEQTVLPCQPRLFFGSPVRFELDSLRTVLRVDAMWLGCNILVVCDFCNSGALLRAEHDLGMSSSAVRLGYARQIITSCLRDTPSYVSQDGTLTRLTELLVSALGPSLSAFDGGKEHITAIQLRQRLQQLDKQNTFQAMLVGHIWDDWSGTPNDGDIVLFRDGSGVS